MQKYIRVLLTTLLLIVITLSILNTPIVAFDGSYQTQRLFKGCFELSPKIVAEAIKAGANVNHSSEAEV